MESTSLNNNIIAPNQIEIPVPSTFTIFCGKILDVFKCLRDLCFKSTTPITSQVVEEKVLTEEEKIKLEEQQKKAKHLKNVITEIKTTEKSYQAGLQTLEDLLTMLEKTTDDKKIAKLAKIARNLNASSKLFLEKLGNAENSDDLLNAFNKEDIENIYNNFTSYIESDLGDGKHFQSIMKTHETAISKFFSDRINEKLNLNKKTNDYLGCNCSWQIQAIKIEDPLAELQILPLQRMTRYPLLFSEAVKSIDESKKSDANEIKSLITDRLIGINETKRKVDVERKKNVLVKLFNKIF